MNTGEFRKKLDRAIKLAIREMRDGCLECDKALCRKHWLEAILLVAHPRQSARLSEILWTTK